MGRICLLSIILAQFLYSGNFHKVPYGQLILFIARMFTKLFLDYSQQPQHCSITLNLLLLVCFYIKF